MRYEWLIGLRYLTSTRSRSAPSIITVFALLGEALGVTALILVLSIMGGFEGDLRTKILGTKSHALVTGPSHADLQSPDEVLAIVEASEHVTGTSPFIESELMISSPANYGGIVMRGIDVERLAHSTEIEDDMIEGSLDLLLSPNDARRGRVLELERELHELERQLDETERQLAAHPAAEGSALAAAEGSGASAEGSAVAPAFQMPSLPPPRTDEAVMPGLPAPGGEGEMPGFEPARPREIPGVVIGAELQETLMVRVGDTVDIISPDGDLGPSGPIPRARRFRVVGVFHTGLYEYDSKMAYVTLDAARTFLDFPEDMVTGIEVRVDNMDHADDVAESLEAASLAAGYDVEVSDWKELNSSLFSALMLEKAVMFALLLTIVLVASFAIVCVLIMVVIEKQREIGILRSMGASRRSIWVIFMLDGGLIGIGGTIIGLIVGLGLTTYLQTVGWPLDPEVYYIDRLPVEVSAVEVVTIAVTAVLISLLATIYPSVQAARLDPVTALRYD